MNQIIPAYHDPLFSILIIVAIALSISLITYGWSLYKQQYEENNLVKFLEKFDNMECTLDTESMPFEPHMTKPLSLLAKAFENAGEYHKAITIYLYLIKHIDDPTAKLKLMEVLGKVYLQAGFLVRAETIYEEILRQRPRNPQVLYALGIVYETKQQFDKAVELLEPLEVLNEDTGLLKHHLALSTLKSDKTIVPTEKVSRLLVLVAEEPLLYRNVLHTLFAIDTDKAWENVDERRLHEVIDILWHLPHSQLNLDIIHASKKLRTLYYAKGYLNEVNKESGLFALDMLANAKENHFESGDLHFSYLCTKCKRSYPVSFKRCPNCMSLHTIIVEEYIAKSNPETDYSLF